MSEGHTAALEKLCRVCGDLLAHKKSARKYKCSSNPENLLKYFGIDIRQDNPLIHPLSYCHPCHSILCHSAQAEKKRKVYHPTKKIFNWREHIETGCSICAPENLSKKIGRPKKAAKGGRPPKTSPKSAAGYIKSIAPTASTHLDEVTTPELLPALECPLCLGPLNQPIELSECKNYVCAECLCEWLRQSESLACPCCYSDHLESYETLRPAPDIVLSVLADQKVTCRRCNQTGPLKHLDAHIDSKCVSYFTPSQAINEILTRAQDSPLTGVELKLQSSLVRRSISTSPVLQVKTRGQVSQ